MGKADIRKLLKENPEYQRRLDAHELLTPGTGPFDQQSAAAFATLKNPDGNALIIADLRHVNGTKSELVDVMNGRSDGALPDYLQQAGLKTNEVILADSKTFRSFWAAQGAKEQVFHLGPEQCATSIDAHYFFTGQNLVTKSLLGDDVRLFCNYAPSRPALRLPSMPAPMASADPNG